MKKKLILIAAPPASGKTFVADRLAKALRHVAYFDKDTLEPLVSAAFDTAGEEHDMDGAFYRAHIRPAEYETVFRLATEALQYEDIAMINAPFGLELRHAELLATRRKAWNAAGIEVILVWILTTPQLCRARMEARGAERDRKKLADWESYAAGICYDPPTGLVEAGAVDRMLLFENGTEEQFERSLQQILSELDGKNN